MNAGWASCAITENGFVRIVSQLSFAAPLSVSEAINVLRDAKNDSDHEFWPDDVSITDSARFDHERLLRSDGITDAYLLAIAVKNRSRLVTFDRSIAVSSVAEARIDHLFVVA
jgi:uncharacterized protein